MSEEDIFVALASLMVDIRWTRDGEADPRKFLTVSRKLKTFADISGTQQPAIFQAEYGDMVSQASGMPYKNILGARWVIFHTYGKGDSHALGSTENNLILDGIREVLKPKPTDPGFFEKRNTLGGLVHHCFLEGSIFKDPGDLDGQAMMVVPIKVLVP